MGGSSYSSSVYTARVADVKSRGVDYFSHSAAIKSGKAENKVHADLDPALKNKAGKIVRESFDSDTHPESRAVGVLFDVTGSMGMVPREFVDNLGTLMGLLVKKGVIQSPHVLFGAIGDATCDKVPLQIGQFEAGNEMDDVLSKIVLEGGGGGGKKESYELGMYFMARHTDLDCFNKRGDKGLLFIAGDEMLYPNVSKTQVKNLIGADLQDDIPTATIFEELKEKYEVFWIYPEQGSYLNDSTVVNPLKAMFGQNFLVLKDAKDVATLVAKTIGLLEGYDESTLDAGLKDLGVDDKSLRSASSALSTFRANTSLATATLNGLTVNSGHDSVVRL